MSNLRYGSTNWTDELSKMAGSLGIQGVQFGSHMIPAAPLPKIGRLSGFGDEVSIGDVVWVDSYDKSSRRWRKGNTPNRIFDMFKENGALIQHRTVDDGPIECRRCVPLARHVETEDYRLRFRLVTKPELVAWFDATRRLKDGEHKLDYFMGRVRVQQGTPVEVVRAWPDTQMAYAVELASQISGFDLTISRTYSDKAKTVAAVKKAVRRNALKLAW